MSGHRHARLLAAVLLLCSSALAPGAVEFDAHPDAPYDSGPPVRVNHVGYFRYGPKRATLVSAATEPVEWELRDAVDEVVARGTSRPSGYDAAAGLDLHVIDFSGFTGSGDGFTLAADGARSFAFRIGVEPAYEQLRADALAYFYVARSGTAIDAAFAGGYARPAGHAAAPGGSARNQGDVDVPCQSLASQTAGDGSSHYGGPWRCPEGYALDVTGGWYDAGDHGKYVVNGAVAVAQLLGAYERVKSAANAAPAGLRDGTLRIPEAGNGVPDVLDEARWELEWMLSMQVPAGSGPQQFDGRPVDVAGMVHHKIHDEGWTEPPLLPHHDPQPRSLHRPSTAATLDLAAVAAQGARLWAGYDAAYSARLLTAAETAYRAARAHPDLYAPPADAEGGGPYDDTDVTDEFYWAAAELFITTGDTQYRDDVLASPAHTSAAISTSGFGWRDVAALAQLDLASVPNDLPGRGTVRWWVVWAAEGLLAVQARQPMDQPYAGASDGAYAWGSNGQILNNLVVLGTAFDLTGARRFADAAMRGVDYLFGRNAVGWSYVTGYGEPGFTADDQHSRWWAAALDPDLPRPPVGAVTGGPNSDTASWDEVTAEAFASGCAPQRCYVDHVAAWSTNEVAINLNSALAWVASFVADLDDGAFAVPSRPPCTVAYSSNGVRATLTVTNTGPRAWPAWDAAWGFTGSERVTGATGARLASQYGPWVEIESPLGAPPVAPGSSAVVALSVEPGAVPAAAPERFRVGGEVCAVAEPS